METAQLILKSGTTFTSEGQEPFPGGVAIGGGRILAVGGDDVVDGYAGESTAVYHWGDRVIMPGFFDAHVHLRVAAATRSQYVCTSIMQAASAEQCVELVKSYGQEHPDYRRIVAYGWYSALWENKQHPDRHMLDRVIRGRPVYLYALDGHAFWLNTNALNECGITKDTQVEFGSIEKDENGEVTGYLVEMEACGIAEAHSIFDFSSAEMKDMTQGVLREMAQYGITSAGDMSNMPKPEKKETFYRVLKGLEEEGTLTARFHLYPSMGTTGDFQKTKELRQRYSSEKVRVAGLKQFVESPGRRKNGDFGQGGPMLSRADSPLMAWASQNRRLSPRRLASWRAGFAVNALDDAKTATIAKTAGFLAGRICR